MDRKFNPLFRENFGFENFPPCSACMSFAPCARRTARPGVCFSPGFALTFVSRNLGRELHGDWEHCLCSTCILCRALCPWWVLQFLLETRGGVGAGMCNAGERDLNKAKGFISLLQLDFLGALFFLCLSIGHNRWSIGTNPISYSMYVIPVELTTI